MHSLRLGIPPAFVALIGITATALALLTTAQEGVALWHAGQAVPWLGLFKARLVDWYACALFVPLLIGLVRRYPIDRPRWPHHLPILLLAAVPIAVAKEAVFVAVGNVFRPGLFDFATILSEDLGYEVMAVWAMTAVCHVLVPRERAIRKREQRSDAHEIEVPTRHGVERVALEEIEYVDAQGNYARLVTPRGRYLVRETMARMETRLGGEFLRVHRSVIVRLDRIERVQVAGNGNCWILLESGARLRAGRSYRQVVLARATSISSRV
ncbi:MAG TPA: LytTR family DNA-binding domain-containing protein [Steroidobacteraceae bacterium]|nr:LytTR family DNA-binding domain-containing protein [Steroidobacteraceae bacterium]